MLLALAGCAPTSLAPSIIRYEPIDPTVGENRLGIRTGPRLGPSLTQLDARNLDKEVGTPLPPELGVALEYVRLQPLTDNLAVHLGVQAELMYAIPFPGLSAMAGLSYRWQFGNVSIAPSISGRAGTDFGTTIATTPGSFVGGDLGVSLSASEGETARLGVTPFIGLWQGFRPGVASRTVFFPGVMVFVRFGLFELMAGFGRVLVGNDAWNVPLLGVRIGGN